MKWDTGTQVSVQPGFSFKAHLMPEGLAYTQLRSPMGSDKTTTQA